MKRIYLLMLAVVGISVAASAQRVPDLTIKHYYRQGSTAPVDPTHLMVDGTHLIFDGDGNVKIHYSLLVSNIATAAKDSVTTTDTLHVQSQMGSIQDVGLRVPANGNSGMFWNATFPKAFSSYNTTLFPASDAYNMQLCDSVWFTSPVGSPNPVAETNFTNNRTCNNVIIDVWALGVNDVEIEGNGLLLYPNPATTDLTIVYNFGTNSSANVTITDITGKVVFNKELGSNLRGLQHIPLHMGGLTPGMYSLKLSTNDKTVIEKIYVK